jgi:hypothetical protein
MDVKTVLLRRRVMTRPPFYFSFCHYFGRSQICALEKNPSTGFTRYWSKDIHAPYAVFQNNQWLGYDDIQSLQFKV